MKLCRSIRDNPAKVARNCIKYNFWPSVSVFELDIANPSNSETTENIFGNQVSALSDISGRKLETSGKAASDDKGTLPALISICAQNKVKSSY